MTDTQQRLLVKQLRKARDEVARAGMMLTAVTDDEGPHEALEDLEDMVAVLAGIIHSIVKAEREEEPGEDDEESS
jgi:hypothetical protein